MTDFNTLPQPVKAEFAARALARRSLIAFTKRFYPKYEAGWIHNDIAKRLEQFSRDVVAKKSPRLAIFMPPRHGKSELASIRFPAWHLGHYPDHEIINCGYNLDLPMKFSRKVREIVRDPGYGPLYPETKLDPDSQSAEAWNTLHGGGFTAAGVGGGITGKGAHILIIDDPVKNQEEADSAITRDGVWEWYWSTAYTRLAPGGGVLLIQTRWHDDDLGGRILSAMHSDEAADQFEVVIYPAIAETYEFIHEPTNRLVRLTSDEVAEERSSIDYWPRQTLLSSGVNCLEKPEEHRLVRIPGDPLHPERYNAQMMTSIKANQTPRVWSALYQQNPVPDEGMFFQKEWIKWEPQPPAMQNVNVYQAWDFAIGEKAHNDWTVGVTLVQDAANNLHFVDMVRIRGDSHTITSAIIDFAQKWGTTKSCPLLVGFEDTHIWKAIRPYVLDAFQQADFYPSYEELRPLTDKLARAASFQGKLQHGKFWFPQGASFAETAVNEMLRFPAGVHDDIVDALAWAVNLCVDKKPRPQPKQPGVKSWKDNLSKFISNDTRGGGHMSA
jgi:predicted phage terminase large subunit-like protein